MVKAKQLPIFRIPTENTAFVTYEEKKKKAMYLLSAHHIQM